MALVIEDGTNVTGANSYATVAQADATFAAISDTVWGALDSPAKERFLIAGTAYVDNQQIYPYAGSVQFIAQWLAWPRTRARFWRSGPEIPESFVPIEVIRATIIAAGLAARGELPTQGFTNPNGVIETKKEKVDALEVEYFHSKTNMDRMASAGGIGASAVARFGHPYVSGVLLPVLDEDLFLHSDHVTRRQAARRLGVLLPAPPVPAAFFRGMFDRNILNEDTARKDGE